MNLTTLEETQINQSIMPMDVYLPTVVGAWMKRIVGPRPCEQTYTQKQPEVRGGLRVVLRWDIIDKQDTSPRTVEMSVPHKGSGREQRFLGNWEKNDYKVYNLGQSLHFKRNGKLSYKMVWRRMTWSSLHFGKITVTSL